MGENVIQITEPRQLAAALLNVQVGDEIMVSRAPGCSPLEIFHRGFELVPEKGFLASDRWPGSEFVSNHIEVRRRARRVFVSNRIEVWRRVRRVWS